MNARTTFLYSTSEFQQKQPIITNIKPSDTFPLINSTIYITASVSNANDVYCGLRGSVMDRFSRIQMLDNGMNGDGAPGDGVYGAKVSVSSPEIQYYIYAENNNAGIFSPQRAEHEWFTLNSDYTTLTIGQVVINEIAAINSSIQKNGLGNFNDWIELYNNTNDTVLLDNLFISDDFSNSRKWQCPLGVKILPKGYQIIWADNDVFAGELHSGFALSGRGEQVILSYADGTIIDSISFPAQRTDISYGRYPNGTGSFVFMPPTYNSMNLVLGLTENGANNKALSIYPNPFYNRTIFYTDIFLNDATLSVYNLYGQQVSQIKNIKGHTFALQRYNLSAGLYLVQLMMDNKLVATDRINIVD